MVYRRRRRAPRRYNRRRTSRYRRTFRKRNYSKPNKIYYFKRNFKGTDITLNPINFFSQGYLYSLGQLPNVSEFQNLFDLYQIRAIKLVWRPEQTESISINDVANAQMYSRFFSAVDLNNDSAALNADVLRQYSTVKVTGLGKIHTRYWKPKTVDSNGSNPAIKPWLPTTNTGIPHYGIKVYIEPNGSTGGFDMKYSCEGTMYLAFKNVL